MNADVTKVEGLYVHIPFCDGKCFYCAFYSRPYESGRARRYLEALAAELKQYPALHPETIYFGGGTPSVLSAPELRDLCGIIRDNVPLAALKEWTVEANPGSLTTAKLAILAEAGVNRISLGAQAFDNRTLKWLGRRHSVADIHDAARMIKAAGFVNFGLDLITCVPGFKPEVWLKTLNAAMALKPKHISVYALTREEGARLAEAVVSGKVTPLTDDEELAALNRAAKMLSRRGYRRYEISNYAKPGYACLHNLACWRGEEYIGLGPAAASHIGLKRWTNLPDLDAYLAALKHGKQPQRALDILDKKLKQVEKIVFGLRMAEGISAATAENCRGTLVALRKEGLVIAGGGRWRLTERGRNLADYVGGELLAGAS